MTPLRIPADLPEYTRDYMQMLDDAMTAMSTDERVVSALEHRNAAKAFRKLGKPFDAERAEGVAGMIDRDPRLYLAGTMYNQSSNGTTKLMLHTFIGLLLDQLQHRDN